MYYATDTKLFDSGTSIPFNSTVIFNRIDFSKLVQVIKE